VIVQKFAAQTASFCRHAPLFADKHHYLPTRSTICRHRHLFAYTGSYLPTQATISRQKRHFFADTFLTCLRSQPSETFHFPFRAPPSSPLPLRSELRPDPPARRPASGSCWPSSLREIKNGTLFADKMFIICRQSLLFAYNIYYLPTKCLLFADKVYYFATRYTICRQRFIICRQGILFADKGSLFADKVYYLLTKVH
jgi:hypothetical protein